MNIYFMINTSEKNKIKKTVTQVQIVSGNLKETSSIINPVFIVQTDNNFTYKLLFKCNYLNIPEFNRKYFITNITTLTSDFFEVSAHVDVLESFQDEILTNTAIIKRQANTSLNNMYLNDGYFRVYQKSQIQTLAFPYAFNKQEFILTVAGDNSN